MEETTPELYTSVYNIDLYNPSTIDYGETDTGDGGLSYVAQLIVYVFIGSFGLIGNIYVFVVLLKSGLTRKSIFNRLISYQSFLDATASFWILITCYIRYDQVLYGTAGDWYCKLWMSKCLMWGFFMASTYNLVLATLERYLNLIFPLFYKKFMTTRKVITIMIIITFASLVFHVLQESFTSGLPNNKVGKCILLSVFKSESAARGVIFFTYVSQFFGPWLIMLFSYVHIFIFLFLKSRNNSMGQGPDGKRAEKLHNASMNILKTMVTVCVVFFICYVGNMTSFVLIAFNVIKPYFDSPLYHVSTYLCFMNCTVNPIIYSIQYKDFQEASRKIFCGSSGGNA